MAKRFIDTGLFSNKWFMKLSKDAKLLWVYMFTNCDHAGIIELNEELIIFQTKIKGLEAVIKELNNNLIFIGDDHYFLVKFLDYQYPGFPNSNVRSQISAIEILKKYGLWDIENQILNFDKINSLLTLNKGFTNPYGNGTGTGNGFGNGSEEEKKEEKIILKPFEVAFTDFLEMRKKIKKPATPRAIELLKKKLSELSNNDENLAVKILEQSTLNDWQDLYPLKNNNNGSSNNNSGINKQSERIKQNLATAARLAEKYEREGIANNSMGE